MAGVLIKINADTCRSMSALGRIASFAALRNLVAIDVPLPL